VGKTINNRFAGVHRIGFKVEAWAKCEHVQHLAGGKSRPGGPPLQFYDRGIAEII